MAITRTELIRLIAERTGYPDQENIELAVKAILEKMSSTLQNDERIEIRGFGSFCLHHRAPRIGRNPKTGERVNVPGKVVPHFKPGKELRLNVNTDNRKTLQNGTTGRVHKRGGKV